MSNIRIELQLEDGSFVTGVKRAGQTMQDFRRELARTDPHFRRMAAAGHDQFVQFNRLSESSGTLLQRMRDISIVAGGISIAFQALTGASNSTIGNIVRVNAEMERLKYQMAGMSDAADPMKEAAENVETLKDMARSAPFSIGQLSNSFVKLKAAGIDPMKGSLKALTNGLAAFGATDEQFNRVTIAITQMQGKGVLSMEELRQQLGESFPAAMKLMARSMGVTVGELAKMVSTGTVESKSALDKFFAEMQASYGGTGEFMMKTFTGQLAKIRTAFVDLATGGEMEGAFTNLKEKMGDFATFLGTDQARQFFDTLGRGFQTAMEWGEKFVELLGTFRDMFGWMAGSLPYIIGGTLFVAAGRRIAGVVRNMIADYRSLQTSANAVGLALRNLHAGAAVGAISAAGQVRTAADAAAAAAMAAQARGASSSAQNAAGAVARNGNKLLGPLVAAGGRFLGLLGPIAMGISILGPIAWEVGKGIWSWYKGADEAKKSVDSVAKAQTNALKQQQAAEEAALRLKISRQEDEINSYFNRTGDNSTSMLNNLEKLWDDLGKMEKRHAEESLKLGEEIEDSQIQEAISRISERTREISRAYNKQMIEADTQYNKDLEDAKSKGQSQRAVQENYRDKLAGFRIERMKAEIALYDEEIEKMKQGTEASQGAIAGVIAQRDQLIDQMKNVKPEDFTMEFLTAPENDEKKMERLVRFTQNAQDKVKELQAELGGASGAVAKLAYQMKRGDFGRLDDATAEMEKMRDLLLESTVAAETLDEVLKGTSEADREITRIYDNLRKENLRMEANIAGIDVDDDLAMFKFMRERGEIGGVLKDAESTVRAALDKVTNGVDLTVVKFDTLATSLKETAFGEDSVTKINQVAAALQGVQNITAGIGQNMLGISFDKMGMPGGPMPMLGPSGMPRVINNVDGGILDLIAGVESGGDYNATLDNGLWTGGPKNLTGMTLKQVRELQKYMLSNPANRAKYGNGKGSSALGRYQIVGQTLEGLMQEMGLSGNELFDENMQDAMARRLLARRGASPAGLRNEWEGLNRKSDVDILSAIARSASAPIVTARPANTVPQPAANSNLAPALVSSVVSQVVEVVQPAIEKIDEKLDKAEDEDARRVELQGRSKLADFNRDLDAARRSQENEDGDLTKYGSKGREIRENIAKDEYKGVDPVDIERAVKAADEFDSRQKQITENSKAERDIAKNREKLENDLAEASLRRAEALKKVKDPNFKGQSTEMKKLVELEREQLALVEQLHGKDSDEYRLEAKRLAQQRAAVQNADAAEALEKLAGEARSSETAAISNEREQRKAAFEERIKELNALRDQAIEDSGNVAEAEKLHAAAVAAERRKYAKENQLGLAQSLDQMGKIGENINKKTETWGQSLSDSIYQQITGQGNWVSGFVNMIREQVAKSLTDAAAASLLKPFQKLIEGDGSEGSGIGGMVEGFINRLTGWASGSTPAVPGTSGGGGLFSGMQNAMKSMMTGIQSWFANMFGKSGVVPVKHTGGIVGAGGGWGRAASAANFIGAPKFHTGGIIGGTRLGLNPSEVPIIAKKGEGVFTPDQMKHLGGSMQNTAININGGPITVNGGGGTSEQNADLAKQIAREHEKGMRALVQDEMVKQMRTGGMLHR